VSAVAQAQSVESGPGTAGNLSIASFDPEDAVAPVTIIQGRGIKVGEGTVLHPVFGMETGYISNVFYENFNQQPSGVLRLLGEVGVASLSGSRLNPNSGGLGEEEHDQTGLDKGSLQYLANVRLAYDQMLSGTDVVQNTGGLGAGVTVRAMANPMGKVSLGVYEDFLRSIRAANFETSTNDNRDINNLTLSLLLHPPGRSLSGYLYYHNTIDAFESDEHNYPSRMANRVGLHPMWRWLPETLVYGDFSWGVNTGIGSSAASMAKVTSYPLALRLGIASLLTMKIAGHVDVGYVNGFYSSGPSYQGPRIDTTLSYRYSPLGQLGVGYTLVYMDSINANYFRDHLIRAFVQHGLDPFVVVAGPELHFREYVGVTAPGPATVRDDVIFAFVGGIHYAFRNWIAATLNYRFSTVQTDFRYMDTAGNTIDPSYTRHQLMLGVRVAM
jgi:hypothetical protein